MAGDAPTAVPLLSNPTLWGAIVGAASGLVGSFIAQWWQSRREARRLVDERRRDRRAKLENIYAVALRVVVDDQMHHSPAELWATTTAALELFAPATVRDAFDKCRDLHYEHLPSDEHDSGTPDMKAAYSDLAKAIRDHLDAIDPAPPERKS